MSSLRIAKPTTPGQRGKVSIKHDHLHKGAPHRALLTKITESGGRNSAGRITVRHRGGRVKRQYRIIDFKRHDKQGIPARVERIEYDPNRSAHIALLKYADGEWRYIIAAKGMRAGNEVISGPEAPIAPGNALPIRNIPVGTIVYCVELKPGKGAQMARSAGAYVQILAKEHGYATLRMRSGEMRKVSVECWATVGTVSNNEHFLRKDGKAGRKRHLGIRPTVRGVAMNPVDHPLGGGEGRTSGGRPSCSPTAIPKGRKTRRNKRTDKDIVRRRSASKGRK